MALLSLIEKEIGNLFSDAGVAGIQVASTATIHLRQQGSFDPATGTISNGNYYDPTAGTFTGSTEASIKVIQRKEKDFNKIEGKDGTVKLLVQPMHNLTPSQLVGVRLDYNSRTYGIFNVDITRLGNSQLVWELMCQ
tara:strand:+ start:63 stop:473 length:411 start_codon:yes stop_codon:yes gene_type:complete